MALPVSVTDIANLTILAIKVCGGLRKTKGAAARYEKAKQALNSLDGCLSCLESGSYPDWTRTAIEQQLEVARREWSLFKEYLSQYDRGLSTSASIIRSKKLYKTVSWTLDEYEGRVDKLESAITRSLSVVTPLMLAELRDVSSRSGLNTSQETASISKGPPRDDELALPEIASSQELCWAQKGGCLCRCHSTTARSGGRFVFAVCNGVSALFVPCNLPLTCDSRRYNVSLRVALTRIGLPIAISFGIEFQTSLSGFHLSPSLSCQRVVPYTSAGFVLLAELSDGPLLSPAIYSELDGAAISDAYGVALASKLLELKRLFAAGLCSAMDVDPSGETFLENVVRCPWDLVRRGTQWELIKFLIGESSRDVKSNPRLLRRCFSWIGEGPHLSLLELMLTLGLDPSVVDAAQFGSWPAFSSPNWLDESITPDPFGLVVLRWCLQIDPDFAGCPPIVETLFHGSDEQFASAVREPRAVQANFRNTFGQTAVHCAVLNPKRLETLVLAGADINCPDQGGSTPLMYAAAYGDSRSVICLLQNGAVHAVQDQRNRRIFSDYAVLRKHQHVLRDFTWHFRSSGQHVVALDILDRCTVYHMMTCEPFKEGLLRWLLEEGADADTSNDAFGTLMHLVSTKEEAEALLNAREAFTYANCLDKNGLSPLMFVIKRLPNLGIGVISSIVDLGADLSAQDLRGWTPLMHLVNLGHSWPISYDNEEEVRLEHLSRLVACFNLLISKGADAQKRDCCQCRCSVSGCSIATIALHGVKWAVRKSFNCKSLPYLLSILYCCMETFDSPHLKDMAQDARSFVEYEHTGLGHTCCEGGYEPSVAFYQRVRSRSGQHQSNKGYLGPLRNVPLDSTDDDTALTHALCDTLGSLYALIEHRSQTEHASALAREKTQQHKHKAIGNGPLVVDKIHDKITQHFIMPVRVPPVRTLDFEEVRKWTERCKTGRYGLRLGTRRQRWAESMTGAIARLEVALRRARQSSSSCGGTSEPAVVK